jgi:hypothetical protein
MDQHTCRQRRRQRQELNPGIVSAKANRPFLSRKRCALPAYLLRSKCQIHQCPMEAHSFKGLPKNVR